MSRAPDGSHNDLEKPAMGAAGTRFGRNFPLDQVYPDEEPAILDPNPRTVSLELLTRETFEPATTLNLLAAAGFSSWCTTGSATARTTTEHFFEVALATDDPWPVQSDADSKNAAGPDARSEREGRASHFRQHASRTGGTRRRSTGPIVKPRTACGPAQHGKLRIGDDGSAAARRAAALTIRV